MIFNKLFSGLFKSGEDGKAPGGGKRARLQKLTDTCFEEALRPVVMQYIDGSISFTDLKQQMSGVYSGYQKWVAEYEDYYSHYGEDVFLSRALAAYVYMNKRNFGMLHSNKITEKVYVSLFLKDPGLSVDDKFFFIGRLFEITYWVKRENVLKALAKGLDSIDFSSADVSLMGADCRELYVRTMGGAPERFKEKLMTMTADSSTAVQAALTEILVKTRWTEEISGLLSSKKQNCRALAVSVLEKTGAAEYTELLKKALEAEKNMKLKSRMAALCGVDLPAELAVALEENNEAAMIKNLIGGGKSRKFEWIFSGTVPAVHTKEGSEETGDILKAIMMCYVNAPMARSSFADLLAEKLVKEELEEFARNVFGLWLSQGASTKSSWVLSFCVIYGNPSIIDDYIYTIKDWSENSRGAIAAEAVRALALNGSSKALMSVDNMARKFKQKQVKNAAADALNSAAAALGITKEELSDRIVPDLGFDERMCRVFDFGPRQFQVYLTPSLDIEIVCNGKQVKSLPKPGAADDAAMAEQATADFKEMKKQMKTVIASQKDRLEYVLLCDRKWTAENWKKLFVRKPVMHCFAIGLIWGVYQEDKLVTSFRYLEDGSFTTSSEDEFELPEAAQIGLVHPLDLSEEEKQAWVGQLSDYEITQPFPQLNRIIYLPTDAEMKEDKVLRFRNIEMSSLTLIGRMLKMNWEKGHAEDAGVFSDFWHNDITGIKTLPDNTRAEIGIRSQFTFSGTYIGAFSYGDENVKLGELRFFDAGNLKRPLKISEVSRRYFSEIIYQLTNISAGTEKET